jgi:hypothetical protein
MRQGVQRRIPRKLLGETEAVAPGDVSFAVPPGPYLVGNSVYWQAVVGPAPGLTNLESTTITSL